MWMRSRRAISRAAFTLLVAWAGNVTVYAQTVNPNVVEFLPPADHSQVSRYDLAFYTLTAGDPFLTVNIGKPTPQLDGLIRVDLTRTLTSWPEPNVISAARVISVASGASNASLHSNSFVFQCDFSLSSTGQSFSASGGSSTVSLTTQSYCSWKATSSSSWITVSTAGGTGSATIGYSVASHTSTTSRTGTVTVAGLTYTVTQAAAATSPSPVAPNAPPTVTITRPSAGSTINGRQVKIDASASDSDGSIASVAFYVDDKLVGTSSKAPYSIQWSPDTNGTYTFKALATDNLGATAWSPPVTATVR